MKIVIKLDGCSISTSKNIKIICQYLKKLSKKNKIIIVCAAINKTTDDLIKIAKLVESRDQKSINSLISKIIKTHKKISRESINKKSILDKLLDKLDKDFDDLKKFLYSVCIIGEITSRSLDYLISFGEKLSINVISYTLTNLNCRSFPLTGKEVGIVTDSNFGKSNLLINTTELNVSKKIQSLLGRKLTPVVGGFAGADQYGHITTFGRRGSDYTATIIASCIHANEIWIMGNSNGLMTADPTITNKSSVLKEVSYAEATEMNIFGKKQIHPRAFEPLMKDKIPMRIRNALDMHNTGTYISSASKLDVKKPVKCISTIKHNGLIDIRGSMIGLQGTAAKIFATLAHAGVNVMMISQNPSESSISIIVQKTDIDKAVHSLEINLLGKLVKNIDVTTDVAIIALIGSSMRGTVGIASKVFNVISNNNVNVVMIVQGSSELNLSFVISDMDCDVIVRSLHDEFNLSN
ncbi:MAG: aspartate kinase [Thaumarchaeota archaeon]|nr:aspartate kinase [Nitrososphaerota archaeon]MCY3975928.1 aspartate kinase [Nitrososphaerota archaeon]